MKNSKETRMSKALDIREATESLKKRLRGHKGIGICCNLSFISPEIFSIYAAPKNSLFNLGRYSIDVSIDPDIVVNVIESIEGRRLSSAEVNEVKTSNINAKHSLASCGHLPDSCSRPTRVCECCGREIDEGYVEIGAGNIYCSLLCSSDYFDGIDRMLDEKRLVWSAWKAVDGSEEIDPFSGE